MVIESSCWFQRTCPKPVLTCPLGLALPLALTVNPRIVKLPPFDVASSYILFASSLTVEPNHTVKATLYPTRIPVTLARLELRTSGELGMRLGYRALISGTSL